MINALDCYLQRIFSAGKCLSGVQHNRSLLILIFFPDHLSRRNFSQDFKNELLKRQLAVKKRDRKVVEDLKLYEEKGFLRRLAIPTTEHASLFANSAKPIKRPKQAVKSSSWRDISC